MDTTHQLPRHLQLILLLALPKTSARQGERILSLASRELDWPEALALAEHHRIASPVYAGMERLHLERVPFTTRQTLRQIASLNTVRAAQAAQEIERVSSRLLNAGVPVAVLKGLPLSDSIFGHANIRQSGDIDLFTSAESIEDQIQILGEMGYAPHNLEWRITPKRLRKYTTHRKGLNFLNEKLCFELDLHWRLFNDPQHPAENILRDDCWNKTNIFGIEMRALSKLPLFNYIAAHGINDGWTYLKSMVDLGGLLQQLSPVELDAALLQSRRYGLQKQVSAAVRQAANWLAIDVESAYLESPSDKLAVRVGEQVAHTLVRQDYKSQRSGVTPVEQFRYERMLMPGARAFGAMVLRYAWRPRVWATFDLPDSLFLFGAVLGLLLPPRGWWRGLTRRIPARLDQTEGKSRLHLVKAGARAKARGGYSLAGPMR